MRQHIYVCNILMGLVCLVNIVSAQQQRSSASFIVQADKIAVAGNQLRLVIMNSILYGSYEQNQHTAINAVGEKGIFKFAIPDIKSIVYFALITPADSSNDSNAGIWETGLLEPGDSIYMRVSKGLDIPVRQMKYLVSFSGRGSLKLECLESMQKAAMFQGGTGFLFDSLFHPNKRYIANTKRNVMLAVLQQYKESISEAAYDQLLTDVSYQSEKNRIVEIRKAWLRNKEEWIRNRISQYYDSLMNQTPPVSAESKARSPYYADVYIETEIVRQLISRRSPFSFLILYNNAKQQPGILRDRLITQLLLSYGAAIKERDSLFSDARKMVFAKPYTHYLETVSKLQTGSPAPAFSLQNIEGKYVQLADYAGKVVLLDFWFTGCSPCANFFQYHLDSVHRYFSNNPTVVFISISVDQSKTAWIKSIGTRKYTDIKFINVFTNGEGTSHRILEDYNVNATGFPCPILIDQNGRVATIQRSILTQRQSLIKAIENLLSSNVPNRKGTKTQID